MAERLSKAVRPIRDEQEKRDKAEQAALEKEAAERAADRALMPNLENALTAIRSKIAANFKEKGPYNGGCEAVNVNGKEYFFRATGTSANPFFIEMGQLKDGIDAEQIKEIPFAQVEGDLVRVGFDPVNGKLASIAFIDSNKVMSSIPNEGSLPRAMSISTVEYGTRDMEDFRVDLSTFDSRHDYSKGRFNVMKEKIQPLINAFQTVVNGR